MPKHASLTNSQALMQSLRTAPLLGGDLPQAPCFDRVLFGELPKDITLNFEQKLGRIYEEALGTLIEASPALRLLAANVQIFNAEGQTIGELDYLLRDQSGQALHLELAVKFYLAIEERDGSWRYPGPNATDNWQRKLERLKTHQLALSQTPEAKELLKSEFDIDEIKARQLIYGCLFFHVHGTRAPLPEGVAKNCRTGRWLRVSEWDSTFDNDMQPLIIPKTLWPVPPSPELLPLYKNAGRDELINAARENCTMFTFENSPDVWFLAPDDWAL